MRLITRPGFVKATFILGMLVLPAFVWSHSLMLTCKQSADGMVRCVGEFSDGSDAAGMSVQVKSYDERVLFKGTLGGDSSLQFKRPPGEFFVRLEDGGEHSSEVDHAEIKP
ncbi:MAG: hypothetical protein AB7S86_03095 [Hydrogenophaga sp.]|uniref:hypothetical protein n=1 Tax=Hydrogenophaga sp. TaxID=1904254 RepID=UPI003D0EBE40